MKPTPDTLRLPAALAQQLGIDRTSQSKKGNKGRNTSVQNRKEQRKATRQGKKGQQNGARLPPVKTPQRSFSGSRPAYNTNSSRRTAEDSESEDPFDISDDEDAIQFVKEPKAKEAKVVEREAATKSILKKTQKADANKASTNGTRSPTPPPRVSRAVKDKLQEDDDEIAFLEKKLGLKSKKLPQAFTDDGLDELLSGLDALDELDDGVTSGVKRKRTAEDEWLADKRQKALKARKPAAQEGLEENESEDESAEESDVNGDSEDDDDDGLDGLLDDIDDSEDGLDEEEAEDSEFSGFDSADDEDAQPEKRVRENPYVAPKVAENGTAKYVPPSLRKVTASDSEELTRLRRQTTGLVNRLSEANLVSILGEIENLYRNNPRQHVTSILIELLLSPICESTSARDTDVILRGGFITAIYKIVGTDFGAQVIQRIVELFDEHYARANEAGTNPATDSNKQTSNLITLLCELYNFQVVGSNLIFDYIRLFLDALTELNAELLLKITRISGQQLRQDDPSSLKDIVILLRPAVAKVGEENISVRTKFMIDTINDLKNNKMKTGAVASAVISEHTIRMKKTLGTLNTRNIKGSEPLRIGLKDIQESDKRGKWWLVGASWAGKKPEDDDIASKQSASKSSKKIVVPDVDTGSVDLIELARQNRMNTDIRRAIFITIMSSTDYQDAHLKLLKLKLKKVQEQEIPKVLLHCASSEASYNHYYTLIAKKLCGADRKIKMGFQFALWDMFTELGEGDEERSEDSGEKGDLEMRQLVNLAKVYGHLIASHGLSLLVLKNLNLSYLQEKTKVFLEVMFITVFLQLKGKDPNGVAVPRDAKVVVDLVDKCRGIPSLVQGLIWFLKKVVKGTDIAGGETEREHVRWASKTAIRGLEGMGSAGIEG